MIDNEQSEILATTFGTFLKKERFKRTRYEVSSAFGDRLWEYERRGIRVSIWRDRGQWLIVVASEADKYTDEYDADILIRVLGNADIDLPELSVAATSRTLTFSQELSYFEQNLDLVVEALASPVQRAKIAELFRKRAHHRWGQYGATS